MSSFSETIHAIQTLYKIGSRLALVTSSSYIETEQALKTLPLDEHFDEIITAVDVAHGKPNPEPYLRAAAQLNLAPERCIAIEDSPNGIQSARSAGMCCNAVTTTHSIDELVEANFVTTLEMLEQTILHLLDEVHKG